MSGPTKWSQGFSSSNDSKHDDHGGGHQENVNETANGVASNYPQEPQYDQNRSDSEEHSNSPFFFGLVFNANSRTA